MRNILAITALLFPMAAFAAGSDSDTAPTTSDTTKTCKGMKVWSESKGKCVRAQSGALDDDQLYDAVRELAYAGEYERTLMVLAAMSDPLDDRVLTYKGFVHRKMGDLELGNSYYRQAIARNPNNILARSYMGQGFVASGDLVGAQAQLKEIRARGGSGTWSETSLLISIKNGTTYSY